MANPLGSAPSVILGAGLGLAASTALEPIVEPARQTAWRNNPNRILSPERYAALVAQGAIDLLTGERFALREGFASDKFHELVHLAQRAPTHSEAQDLRRRGRITDAQLKHTFAKEQIEAQYWDALAELVDDRLSAQAVALAIIRSMMSDPGFFPVQLDTSGGKVPAYPVSTIDPLEEARSSGFDTERLRIMVGSIGRPMGPVEAAQALFRQIIARPDFNRAILEGDTRPEWADAILEHARQIPSVADYINAEIRGWIDRDQRNIGIARHGMAPADGDLLYLRTGRPATAHQVHIGWQRGGRNPDAGTTEREVFGKAIQESDIRPEWTDILWAQRYTYPNFFTLRALATGGVVDAAQLEQILLYEGWEPTLAHEVSVFYTQQGQAAADPYIGKAQTQLWTAIHKAFVKEGSVDAVTADSYLTNLIPNAADRAEVIQLWTTEKNLGTPAQPPAV